MSTDTSSAIGSAGMARAPAAQVFQPSSRSAVTPAVPVQEATMAKAAVPAKAELTLDPQQRAREVREAIEKLNAQMRDNGRALQFSVDQQLNRTVITVTNQETGKVVRQIPDEALLRVAHNIDRVEGLLQDQRV